MLTNAQCRSLVANRITNRKRIKCTSLRGLKIILACTDTQRLHNPFALFLPCLVSIFFIIIWLCPLKKAFDFICLFVSVFRVPFPFQDWVSRGDTMKSSSVTALGGLIPHTPTAEYGFNALSLQKLD